MTARPHTTKTKKVTDTAAQPPAEDLADVLSNAIRLATEDPCEFARQVLQLRRLPGEKAPGEPGYNPQLDWELDAWQRELVEAVADVRRKQLGQPTVTNHEGKAYITCRACQGPGKTFGIALVAHIFGFAFDPMVIVCIAPKLEHLKTRFMGEFSKIAHRAVPGYTELMKIRSTGVQWEVADKANHLLVCETGKQPENIQGLRRRFTLYLVDESSGVEERLWPVTEGNLSATELGVRVEIGNPTRNTGHFAKSHNDARVSQDYYRMHVGPQHSRRIKQSWIDRMVRGYGADSPVVRVRCYGEFAASDSRQLIALEWLAAARNKNVDVVNGDGSLPRLRVSVDCAAGGEDETVCIAAKHFSSYVVGLKATRHNFPLQSASIQTADAAELLFNQYGGEKGQDEFVVDSLGVGVGAAGELLARGHRVVLYQGGAASANKDRWRNRRVQTYIAARDAFREDRVVLLEGMFEDQQGWDDFDAQLCSIRTAATDRVEDLVTKEQMKADGLTSPDIGDCWAMQFATQVPTVLAVEHAQPMPVFMVPSEALRNFPTL